MIYDITSIFLNNVPGAGPDHSETDMYAILIS